MYFLFVIKELDSRTRHRKHAESALINLLDNWAMKSRFILNFAPKTTKNHIENHINIIFLSRFISFIFNLIERIKRKKKNRFPKVNREAKNSSTKFISIIETQKIVRRAERGSKEARKKKTWNNNQAQPPTVFYSRTLCDWGGGVGKEVCESKRRRTRRRHLT